jgi:hypothetical protein
VLFVFDVSMPAAFLRQAAVADLSKACFSHRPRVNAFATCVSEASQTDRSSPSGGVTRLARAGRGDGCRAHERLAQRRNRDGQHQPNSPDEDGPHHNGLFLRGEEDENGGGALCLALLRKRAKSCGTRTPRGATRAPTQRAARLRKCGRGPEGRQADSTASCKAQRSKHAELCHFYSRTRMAWKK